MTDTTKMDEFRRQLAEEERRAAIHDKIDGGGMFGGLKLKARNRAEKTAKTSEGGPAQEAEFVPVLQRPKHFMDDIAADAERRREEVLSTFDADTAPKTEKPVGWFRWAARVVTWPLYYTTHNPLTRAAFHNRFTRAIADSRVGRVASYLGYVPEYVHNPFGRPERNMNSYTRVTVNADFYVQAAGAAFFGAMARQAGHALGAASKFVFYHADEAATSNPKKYPWTSRAFRLGRFAWNWGGGRAVSGLYHYVCCEKTRHGDHYFSPLHLLNRLAFFGMMWGAVGVGPYVAAPAVAIGEPFYWKMTEQTYRDMDVRDKSDEDADGVFKLYVASDAEVREANELRKAGADIEDDEIGRRFDIEDSWVYGIYNPPALAGMIPKIGHCDRIDTAGIWFRTPRVKIGGLKLIRAHVWLAPMVRGTQGCTLKLGDTPISPVPLHFETPQYFANQGMPMHPYGTAAAQTQAPTPTLNPA